MSSSAKREMYLRQRTHILELFCSDFDMSINSLNNGYQLRVENLVDFYLVNGRFCILRTGERGNWETAKDIRNIMLTATDQPSQALIDDWAGVDTVTIKQDGYVQPRPPQVEIPALKWPYPPIVVPNVTTQGVKYYNKWYRRLWRLIKRPK